MARDTLEACHGWRWSVFNRVAVLAAAPVASFLTLLLELLLSFSIGEAETEFDAGLLVEEAVVFADDTLSYLTRLESELVSWSLF